MYFSKVLPNMDIRRKKSEVRDSCEWVSDRGQREKVKKTDINNKKTMVDWARK